jgi:hypothetical protein
MYETQKPKQNSGALFTIKGRTTLEILQSNWHPTFPKKVNKNKRKEADRRACRGKNF